MRGNSNRSRDLTDLRTQTETEGDGGNLNERQDTQKEKVIQRASEIQKEVPVSLAQ